ncbi:hypothetical protein Tco_1406405 [Tanacetum coccineum]
MDSVLIRRIQGVGYGVLEFLGVGTTFDIFQNILFPYSLNTAYYLSWIWRIGLVSFMVFGECWHIYAISSLMDMAYWLSEQRYLMSSKSDGLAKSVSIRRIQGLEYGVLGFIGVENTFDIFQNIHILYLQYDVLVFTGYGVLIIGLGLW